MEHRAPASVWADGNWDEDLVGLQHVIIDLLPSEGGVVIWIIMSVLSKLLLILLN